MATLGTYFLDTDSLATATAVWTDSTFTVKAPDGWYQACGIVREQVGGFLLPPDSCAYPCNVDCGDPPIFDNDYFGVYELPDIQVGTGGQSLIYPRRTTIWILISIQLDNTLWGDFKLLCQCFWGLSGTIALKSN